MLTYKLELILKSFSSNLTVLSDDIASRYEALEKGLWIKITRAIFFADGEHFGRMLFHLDRGLGDVVELCIAFTGQCRQV